MAVIRFFLGILAIAVITTIGFAVVIMLTVAYMKLKQMV